MNGLFMTVEGVVGSELRKREFSGTPFLSFRLVSKERRWDRLTQSWQTSHSSWMTVSCFRQLAVNVAQSISKGDLVIVHGKVRVKEYPAADGSMRTNVEVEASSIGHDLKFGTTRFRPAVTDAEDDRLREHAEALNREMMGLQGESYEQLVAQRVERAVVEAGREAAEAALEGVDMVTGELLDDEPDEALEDEDLEDEEELDDEDDLDDEDEDEEDGLDDGRRAPARALAGVGGR